MHVRLRSRAEEFARALENGGPTDPGLARVVEGLRLLAPPPLDDGFRHGLRTRLLTADVAATEPVPTRPVRVVPVRQRLVAFGAGVVVVVCAVAGLVWYSGDSLPGDVTYPVKRQAEDARLLISRGDEADGRLYLQQAGERMDEVEGLLRRSGPRPTDPAVVDRLRAALGDLGVATRRGSVLLTGVYERTGDEGTAATLRAFTAEQRVRLEGVRPLLPAELRDRVGTLLAQLGEVEERVAQAAAVSGRPGNDPRAPGVGPTPGSGPSAVPGGRPSGGPSSTGGPLPGGGLVPSVPVPVPAIPGPTVDVPDVPPADDALPSQLPTQVPTLPNPTVSAPPVSVPPVPSPSLPVTPPSVP